jgi:hypothetical protein
MGEIDVLGARELGGYQKRKGDGEHHQVRGDIQHCVCYQVVDCSGALNCKKSASNAQGLSKIKNQPTVVSRNSPILVKWPAPDTKV